MACPWRRRRRGSQQHCGGRRLPNSSGAVALTSEGLDKDLHAAAQAQHQVQRALLLDVVVGQGAPILQLLARKDQALLVGGDALLVLRQGGRQAGGRNGWLQSTRKAARQTLS